MYGGAKTLKRNKIKRILSVFILFLAFNLTSCKSESTVQTTSTAYVPKQIASTQVYTMPETFDFSLEYTEVETKKYTSRGTPYIDSEGQNIVDSISMRRVDSSAIAAIGYSSSYEAMLIEFHDSGRYLYYSVPSSIYQEFLRADSIGSYYNKNIKGQYRCEKVY